MVATSGENEKTRREYDRPPQLEHSSHYRGTTADTSTGADKASQEYRLRRQLRKLGKLRQPESVVECLVEGKARQGSVSLRAFNVAIAAVAACEGGYRYALKLLALMAQEKISPDRFSLTAAVLSCCRCREWSVAQRVLLEMQRRQLRPLQLRMNRFVTAPGEGVSKRDAVLRVFEDLRTRPGVRKADPPKNDVVRDYGQNPRNPQQNLHDDSVRDGGAMAEEHGVADNVSATGSTGPQGYGKDSRGNAAGVDRINESRRGHGDDNGGDVGTMRDGVRLRQTGKGVGVSGGGGRRRRPVLSEEEERRARTICDDVEQLLADGVVPELDLFLSGLKAAALRKDADGALRLLECMHVAGYPPHQGAYASAMRACGKAGQWLRSISLMNEMRALGLQPGEGCHVMALKACADAGRWEHALAILEGMKGSGVARSENSFSVAIKACGEAGRWPEALAVMDEMRDEGVLAMETTYTAAMRACGLAGKWKQTLRLFEEMRDKGIPPNEHCYTGAIKACAKAGEMEKAMSLLQEMRMAPGVSTNDAVYRSIIFASCEAGDWVTAIGLVEDARRENLTPGTGNLRMIVQTCGLAGEYERALSLLEEMRSEGMHMRKTGEKLWWLFKDCKDERITKRAWAIMEVDEVRERSQRRARNKAENSNNKDTSNDTNPSPSARKSQPPSLAGAETATAEAASLAQPVGVRVDVEQ